MPSYTCNKNDLLSLINAGSLSTEELESLLEYAKSELKSLDNETGELKLENNDTNRPDLWSCEGTARQIRACCYQRTPQYPFFGTAPEASHTIIVEESVIAIRPFIGGFMVTGITVDALLLDQLIQTQEKLCENYGRSRDLIAIGIYDASQMTLPVRYRGVKPDAVRFTPLDFEEELTLDEILEKHPKGIQYAHLVKGKERYPLIADSREKVLSFPPVINSNDLGRVAPGNNFLFVEATGKERDAITLALNILACNIHDRGGTIVPFSVVYPDGTRTVTPFHFDRKVEVELSFAQRCVGEEIGLDELIEKLKAMDLELTATDDAKKTTTWRPPAYRLDHLHAVDLVEDYCISRGYNNFVPEMPERFTKGAAASIITWSDTLRELMLGMSFQEVMTYMLTSRDTLTGKMNDLSPTLEIENIMSESYSVVRSRLVPILLEIESKNQRSEYPHRIFETGEVAVPDFSVPDRTSTEYHLAALVAHSGATFSELSSTLQALMYYLGIEYSLEKTEHPSFISGRVGTIMANNRALGVIGEIHPAVLENWGITCPCAAFELRIDAMGD